MCSCLQNFRQAKFLYSNIPSERTERRGTSSSYLNVVTIWATEVPPITVSGARMASRKGRIGNLERAVEWARHKTAPSSCHCWSQGQRVTSHQTPPPSQTPSVSEHLEQNQLTGFVFWVFNQCIYILAIIHKVVNFSPKTVHPDANRQLNIFLSKCVNCCIVGFCFIYTFILL